MGQWLNKHKSIFEARFVEFRMYLRSGKQGSRVAKLIDSPNLPDNETIFFVTPKGVVDEVE